jgi:hypothetical protein
MDESDDSRNRKAISSTDPRSTAPGEPERDRGQSDTSLPAGRRSTSAVRALRRSRIGLLVGVLLWLLVTLPGDREVLAAGRTRTVRLVIVTGLASIESDAWNDGVEALIGDGSDAERGLLDDLEEWFATEYLRHTGSPGRPVRFEVESEPWRVGQPPPRHPSPLDPWWSRAACWLPFRGFYGDVDARGLAGGDRDASVIFLVLHDFRDRAWTEATHEQPSVAVPSQGFAVVSSAIDRSVAGHVAVILAHEICHLLGAEDQHGPSSPILGDSRNDADQTLSQIQERAEIMALLDPFEARLADAATRIGACAVGEATARELGWIPRVPRANSASPPNSAGRTSSAPRNPGSD